MAGIRVELQLADKSFHSGLLRAGQTLAEFKNELARTNPHFAKLRSSADGAIVSFKKADDNAKGFVQRLKDVAIVGGGAVLMFRALSGASNGTLGNIIRINADMERLKYQLAGLSTETSSVKAMESATKQVAALQDLATKTPFALDEITKSFVKMKVAGIEPTQEQLRILTDGIAAFGGNEESLHRITLGITQMSGKGVIQMEELRQQLGESMPSAMKLMARSMGVSMGDLTRAIATGQVDAQAALKKWFAEVDMTYGGSGERMMETFSGQLALIRTNLTKLLIDENGGIYKAFQKLKEMMGDFAHMLETTEAKEFFDMVGDGMYSVLDLTERVGKGIAGLREYFEGAGKYLKIAFGAWVVGGVLGKFSSGMLAIRRSLIDIRVVAAQTKGSFDAMTKSVIASTVAQSAQVQALAAGMRRVMATTGGITGSIMGGAAMTGTISSLGKVGSLLGSFGALASRFLGILGPVGMAIGVLGPIAWEVGKSIKSWWQGADKTKESVEEVGRSVLETQKIADESARKNLLAGFEAELAHRRKILDARNAENSEYLDRTGRNSTSIMRGVEVAQAELDKVIAARDAALAEFDKNAGDRMAKTLEEQSGAIMESKTDEVNAAMRQVRREYDLAMIDAENQHKARTQELKAKGQSTQRAEEEYHSNIIRIKTDFYDKEKAAWEAEREAVKKMVEEGKASMTVLELVDQKIAAIAEKQKNLDPKNLMVELLQQSDNPEKQGERLAKALETAREKVAELDAELRGASGEIAKLLVKIERGDFGALDDGSELAKRMRKELIETTLAAEAFDNALKDINKTTSAYQKVYDDAQERAWKAQAYLDGVDPDNDFAFLEWKRMNGHLEGAGSAGAILQEQMNKLTQGLNLADMGALTLSNTLRHKAFGNETITAIDSVTSAISRVIEKFAELHAQAGKNPLASIMNWGSGIASGIKGVFNGTMSNAGVPKQVWDFFTGKGLAPHQVAGIMGNIHAESNFVPTARQKSGGGTGLFQHDDRSNNLLSFIGGDLTNVNGQLEFAWQELMTTERRAMQNLLGAKTVEEATQAFLGFERPQGFSWSNPANSLHYDRRLGGAERAMQTFAGVSPSAIATVQPSLNNQNEVIEDAGRMTAEAEALERRAAIKRRSDEIEAARRAALLDAEDDNKSGAQLKKLLEDIATGKLGNNKDINSPEYADLIRQAREADAVQSKITENKKLDREIEKEQTDMAKERTEITQREADARARMKDPNYQGQSNDMRRLNQETQEYLEKIALRYGIESAIYKQEKERALLQQQSLSRAEGMESLLKLKQAADDAEKEAMTDRERERREYDERVAELRALRDHAIRMGAERSEAEKQFARASSAEWKKYSETANGGLHKQIKDMQDVQGQLTASAGSWMSGLSDSIYDSLTGELGSFESLRDKIREDIARSLINAATGSLMEQFAGLFKWLNVDGGGGIGGFLTGLVKGLFGIKHTGGIVGNRGGTKSAPLGVFAGAPRYHTGGIIPTMGKLPGLRANEVPIIAERGEGVFTKDQMKALGGTGRPLNFTSAPTINIGGAGTPEQNSDLADKVAREQDKAMRAVIREELLRQMRPGGMIR